MNQPTAPRGVAMPTVVFGLLVGLVAAVVLVRELTGRTLDVEMSAPIVLLAAGALLVVWAVVGLTRQRGRQGATTAAPVVPSTAPIPRTADESTSRTTVDGRDDAAPSA